MNDIDHKTVKLTKDLSKRCEGQGAVVVVGAALNIAMSAAELIPDKGVRSGLIACFRKIADDLEAQNAEARH